MDCELEILYRNTVRLCLCTCIIIAMILTLVPGAWCGQPTQKCLGSNFLSTVQEVSIVMSCNKCVECVYAGVFV